MSNTEHETEPHIHPGQTPVVRVLLYCFKPPQPRTAASPPPRRAERVIRPYALEWGERVLILGGEGRLGQVTPPA